VWFNICVLCTILSSAYPLLANAAEKYIQLVAAADPWPPYIDEKHPSGGVSVQIADAALRTQGYTVRNLIMPWARAIEETKKARIDLILDAWWSKERSRHFMYSRPYINGPVKFIKRKADPFRFTDLSSLKGKSIVLVRNYAYGDDFLNAKNYEPVLVTHFLQGVHMLALNRVDLAIENELVARSRLLNDAPELIPKIEFVDQPLGDNYVYLISSYQHPQHMEIIGAFNRGLTMILENGEYQKIMRENKLDMPDIFHGDN
jgi:polar amino acid transport system substrate-binding protein